MVAIFKSVIKKGYSDNWKIYECYKKKKLKQYLSEQYFEMTQQQVGQLGWKSKKCEKKWKVRSSWHLTILLRTSDALNSQRCV